MIRYLTIITLCLGLFACRDKSAQLRYQKLLSKHKTLNETYQDLTTTHEKLKAKFDSVSLKNADLRNTPSRRLVEIRKLARESELSKAEKEAEELVKLYPHTEEGKIAKDFVEKLEKRRETKRLEEAQAKEAKLEEEARKKRLGFAVLQEKLNFTEGKVNLKFSDISITRNFVYGRYGGQYRSKPAFKNRHFITATLRITSQDWQPYITPLGVYIYRDGKLVCVDTPEVEYYQWSSYDAFQHKKIDYRNSFEHASSVPFSISFTVEDSLLNRPLFLMAKKSNCLRVWQSENDEGRYIVSLNSYCKSQMYKETLTLDQALKYYHTIKIFNKDKL